MIHQSRTSMVVQIVSLSKYQHNRLMKTCSTRSKLCDQYLCDNHETHNEPNPLSVVTFWLAFFPQSESDRSQSEDVDVWKEDEEDDDIFSDTGLMDVVSALCLNLSFAFQYSC